MEVKDGSTTRKCGICGVKGTLSIINDKVIFEVKDEDRVLSHVLLSGKFAHADELKSVSLNPPANINELPEKLKKYKSYLSYSKPKR